MADISLGGQAFVQAEEVEGFKEVQIGGLVFKVVSVETATSPTTSKTPGATKILIKYDIAEGKNAGLYAELTAKFAEPGTDRYLTSHFPIIDATGVGLPDGMGRLKKHLNTIGLDPANATSGKGPGIVASLAAGNINDELLTGALIGGVLDWKKAQSGKYYENVKKWVPVAEAKAIGPSIQPKPVAEVAPASAQADHPGNDWN